MRREYGENSAGNKESLQTLIIVNTRPPNKEGPKPKVAFRPDLRLGGMSHKRVKCRKVTHPIYRDI